MSVLCFSACSTIFSSTLSPFRLRTWFMYCRVRLSESAFSPKWVYSSSVVGTQNGSTSITYRKNPRVEHEDHLTKRLFWGKTSIFPSIVWLENIKCMLALVPLCTVMCKIIRVTLNFCIFEQLCTLYFNKFVSIHFSQYLKLSLFLKKLLLKISSKFHRVFSNLKKNPPATITDAKHFLGGRSKGPINQV